MVQSDFDFLGAGAEYNQNLYASISSEYGTTTSNVGQLESEAKAMDPVKVTLESLLNLIQQWVKGQGANGIIQSLTAKTHQSKPDSFINEVSAISGKFIYSATSRHVEGLDQSAEELARQPREGEDSFRNPPLLRAVQSKNRRNIAG